MTRKSQSNFSVSFQYPFYLRRFPLSLRNVSDHFQTSVTITLILSCGYFPALFLGFFFLTESYFLGFTLFYHSHVHLVLYSMFVGLEQRRTDEVCCWCSGEKVDHKIFIIQQKCNNTANIFVPEYIVVGDALTMGCAAEMKIYEYCIKQGIGGVFITKQH